MTASLMLQSYVGWRSSVKFDSEPSYDFFNAQTKIEDIQLNESHPLVTSFIIIEVVSSMRVTIHLSYSKCKL